VIGVPEWLRFGSIPDDDNVVPLRGSG